MKVVYPVAANAAKYMIQLGLCLAPCSFLFSDLNAASGMDYSNVSFPAPRGVTANFVDPPSISWQIIAFSLPFTGTATLFVALRLYARTYILRFLGLDDRESYPDLRNIFADIIASISRHCFGMSSSRKKNYNRSLNFTAHVMDFLCIRDFM